MRFFCFSTLEKKIKCLSYIRWASSFKSKKSLCVYTVQRLCMHPSILPQIHFIRFSTDGHRYVKMNHNLPQMMTPTREIKTAAQPYGWKEEAAAKTVTFYTSWAPNSPLSATVPSCSATAGSPSCRDSRTGWRGCCGRWRRNRLFWCAWGRRHGCPLSSRMWTPAGKQMAQSLRFHVIIF